MIHAVLLLAQLVVSPAGPYTSVAAAVQAAKPGDHIVIPRTRHGLEAIEDSVVLLTVVKPVGPHV